MSDCKFNVLSQDNGRALVSWQEPSAGVSCSVLVVVCFFFPCAFTANVWTRCWNSWFDRRNGRKFRYEKSLVLGGSGWVKDLALNAEGLNRFSLVRQRGWISAIRWLLNPLTDHHSQSGSMRPRVISAITDQMIRQSIDTCPRTICGHKCRSACVKTSSSLDSP